jgi:hypothetical protein
MDNHYTYLLEYSDGGLYHGVRSCHGVIDEDDYYGSSKYTPNEVPIKTILTTHNTREEAIEEEIRYHAEFNVKNNNQYYNRANQTSIGFDYNAGGDIRGPMSEEHKKNLSTSLSGRLLSSETKKKMSRAHIGVERKPFSKEHKKNLSKAGIGKKYGPQTNEHQKKRIESLWVGVYITPWGDYNTSTEAAKHCTHPISRSAVYNWCRGHNDKIITPYNVGKALYLKSEYIGKSFKELGFNFQQR